MLAPQLEEERRGEERRGESVFGIRSELLIQLLNTASAKQAERHSLGNLSVVLAILSANINSFLTQFPALVILTLLKVYGWNGEREKLNILKCKNRYTISNEALCTRSAYKNLTTGHVSGLLFAFNILYAITF